MKILLNLTSSKVSFEYMDTTPFIQGTDTRNKIFIYREQSATPALTNLAISYQVQSGRYTLPLGNTSATTETIDGVAYNKWTFSVPTTATALAGNIVACLVVKTASGQYKLNILNNVLESSQFDAFESGLEGAAETYGTAMDNYNSAQTIQDQRLTDLENAESTENTKIGLLNTEVFGTSSGETNTNGLQYIVRTNHEGRLDTLEDLNIGTRLTALEADDSSYETDIASLKTTVYGSTSGQTSAGLVSKVSVIETEIGSDATANSIKGRITKNETDIASINSEIGTNGTSGTIKGRITAIESANYQSQIDAINAGQNLADIVADLTALRNLPTINLHSGDKVQVLDDSNHANSSTVYNWNGTNWVYIGEYGQNTYTKAAVDYMINLKADKSTTYTKSEVDGLLGTKVDKTTTVNGHSLASNITLDKNDIGLGNVDNTSDLNKPISTATQAALDLKANTADFYSKQQVDDLLNSVVSDGYAINWESLCDIFNEVYASDPLMTMLNSINGEVV